ncbi:MAG: tetratricopeptide repeat protein [Candidatus Latescibacteria bacterium]|nr:tetratricopeptide repeat protein [Candidatus Latescibacterota bacterium]
MRHIHEDKFQEFITKIASLYYHQRQKFLIGVGVIVVAIVAIIIGVSSSGKENPEVQLRFTEALGIYSVAQVPEQFDAAEELFINFTRRFGRHYLSSKAYFYLGNISYQREDYDKARSQFEKAYGKLKNDQVLGPATLFAIGNCYEEQQNFRKAAQVYEQVYNKYRKLPLAADALIAAGRCYKTLNDFNSAERIYQKAVKELPAGEMAEQAKSELAYINAMKNKF